MEITEKMVGKLTYLQEHGCNYGLFQKIYGKNAEHAWRKFSIDFNNNILKLFAISNKEERTMILEHINSKEFDKSHQVKMMLED